MAELKGKTVVVTGGAQRLGRAIALAAADAGADVAFTYLTSKDAAYQTLRHIQNIGVEGFGVKCDVRHEKSIARALESVLDKFGRIDVLVNNAGVFETASFTQVTEEQWDNVFAVNVRGPFLLSKLATPALRKVRGRIIHMGSLGGEKPWPTHAHYCASKAALHMLTRVMAKALAPEITVNCVAPGMIDADSRHRDKALQRRLAQRTPMRRNGNVDDIVQAVLYFATASEFITGQILTVDGGLGL